eukprot:10283192-Alexandrium_andersonii.AAC.1
MCIRDRTRPTQRQGHDCGTLRAAAPESAPNWTVHPRNIRSSEFQRVALAGRPPSVSWSGGG